MTEPPRPGNHTAGETTVGIADTDGERFAFGENWTDFVGVITPARIAAAERSLQGMLELETLSGKSFLDVGCGSGLFSLAALRLGATRVHSFDFDPHSVAAARMVRRRHFPQDRRWTIESGSALDGRYLDSLGEFDVVYAWGVLHHTGDMSAALANVSRNVAADGWLFVSIYNDQGMRSAAWRSVKRMYNRLPTFLRKPYAVMVTLPREVLSLALALVHGRLKAHIKDLRTPSSRGMSFWHDTLDWVGGYPFEVATPDHIFDFFRLRGYRLTRLVTTRHHGCNEFVFRRLSP
jgi:2-polyprenyl-3-methyl-5-hydroxy-6-metoxy-1,4-benzoquinol methylase